MVLSSLHAHALPTTPPISLAVLLRTVNSLADWVRGHAILILSWLLRCGVCIRSIYGLIHNSGVGHLAVGNALRGGSLALWGQSGRVMIAGWLSKWSWIEIEVNKPNVHTKTWLFFHSRGFFFVFFFKDLFFFFKWHVGCVGQDIRSRILSIQSA